MVVTPRIAKFASKILERFKTLKHNNDAAHLKKQSPPSEPIEKRMKLLANCCINGQLAAAELELYQWQRENDCPNCAVVLLASLLARREKFDDAISVLSKHQLKSLDIASMHLALLVDAGLTESARQLARKLFEQLGEDLSARQWLAEMEIPGAGTLPEISQASVENLASELLTEMQLIPSLVAAQQINPDRHNIMLLRRTINHMHRDVDDFDELMLLCNAMTDLAQLSEDHDDLRRWAHRGLRLNPFAVSLALALGQIEDDSAVGPAASAVLRKVADTHKNYPDVQAALIRRENSEGYEQSARMRLDRWLSAEPDNSTALRLKQELAA